jgi:hypothetical protein
MAREKIQNSSLWTFSHSPINSWKGHLSDFEAYLVILAFAKETKRAVVIVNLKNSRSWGIFLTLADVHVLGRELCGCHACHACHVPCVAHVVCVKVKYGANKGKSFANVRYFRLVALFLLPFALKHLFILGTVEPMTLWSYKLWEIQKCAIFVAIIFYLIPKLNIRLKMEKITENGENYAVSNFVPVRPIKSGRIRWAARVIRVNERRSTRKIL